MSNKIIRSICIFKRNPEGQELTRLNELETRLKEADFQVQTKRICSPVAFGSLENIFSDESPLLSVGTIDLRFWANNKERFYQSRDNCNIELSKEVITADHVQILFDIIRNAPEKTFNFTYVFNNKDSSPFMPSASYKEDGFSVGLQPTNLASNVEDLEGWFEQMQNTFQELISILNPEENFLGIDSSIAPLFEGNSSFLYFLNRIYPHGFSQATTTDVFTRVTKFIKEENPKITGLSGLMLPCLEDFDLAKEYEKGNFSIERNIFLSLHSGLGIDTYPIGVNESPERVLEILKLVQALSNKYSKPLSVRFVSDGKAKVGGMTDYQNQYLYDVEVKRL